MADEKENKLKSFFKKAGEDMKRMGAEMKEEAHKLLNDKQAQREWKDNLLGAAKSAAEAQEIVYQQIGLANGGSRRPMT